MRKIVNHQPLPTTNQQIIEWVNWLHRPKQKGMGDVLVPVFAAICAMLWMRPFKILQQVTLRCYLVMFLLQSWFKVYSKRFFDGVACEHASKTCINGSWNISSIQCPWLDDVYTIENVFGRRNRLETLPTISASKWHLKFNASQLNTQFLFGGMDHENHHPRQGSLTTIGPYKGLLKPLFLISIALGVKSAREPLFSMTKSASFLCSSPESWLAIFIFASQGEVNKLFELLSRLCRIRIPFWGVDSLTWAWHTTYVGEYLHF